MRHNKLHSLLLSLISLLATVSFAAEPVALVTDLEGKADFLLDVVSLAAEGDLTSEMMVFSGNDSIAQVADGVKTMLDAYEQGRIDRLFLVSNEFVNTMTQTPTIRQLLPLDPEASDDYGHRWDYIYEPEARQLI